jgi:hypothetical protein
MNRNLLTASLKEGNNILKVFLLIGNGHDLLQVFILALTKEEKIRKTRETKRSTELEIKKIQKEMQRM